MNRNDQEKLLGALLPGEEEADLRGASLAQGLQAIRRKRRGRAAQLYALAFLPFAVALLLFVERLPSCATRNAALNPTRQAEAQRSLPAVATIIAAQPTKVISDEELFALFPGRSLALIGSPGHQKLVFLDR